MRSGASFHLTRADASFHGWPRKRTNESRFGEYFK